MLLEDDIPPLQGINYFILYLEGKKVLRELLDVTTILGVDELTRSLDLAY
mgnify:CR=1 FL=1